MGEALRNAPAEVAVIARPEREILLCCARREMDGAHARRLRAALAAGPDPARLLAMAERHRMIPLLHRHFAAAEGALPAEAAADLRARFAEGARRSLALAGELHRVLGMLAAAGIGAAAYKGPALAAVAYGDLAMRTLSDLDVLVAPADVPRAMEVLAAHGFAAEHEWTPRQERAFRRVDGDYPLWSARGDVLVEVHAHVSSLRFGVRLGTAELLARARPVRVGGAEVPAPAPDDLLLALALHGAKHRWARLEWIAAFAEVARAHPDAVRSALARARALRGLRVLCLGMALARDLLGLPVSAEVDEAISADPALAGMAAEVQAVLFRSGDGPEETAANLAFNLRLREGAAQRALYAWRWLTLPTPEDWNAVKLPDALHPLYRIVRPVRLLARYAPSLVSGRRAP
ncbi:MAG: hypothetical protein JWM27_522 [Gemmatimonadetes bacterium]|nr:hypothetical protein [Gemmatimonadota bacterium]